MAGRSTENPVRVGLVLTHQYRMGSDLFAAVAEQRETLRFIRDRGWDSVMVGQLDQPRRSGRELRHA
jgi:hypothetical protein